MRRIPRWAWFIAAAVALAVAAFLFLRRGGDKAAADAAPLASVTLAAVRAGPLSDIVTAPGTIQAAAGASLTVASPKAAVVSRVLVGPGQAVRAGQPLITLANAPAAELAYRQAADAVKFGEADVARVRQLAGEHLATNDQVSAAEKTLADSRAALAAQLAQGTGSPSQTIVSPAASLPARR